MIRCSALTLVASVLPLVGQTTWGGLRFGMTEAEVKATLKGRLEATGNPPGTKLYTPFRVKSIKVGPATGIASLGFDVKKKTLARVWLNLSLIDEALSKRIDEAVSTEPDESSEEAALPEISSEEAATRLVAYEYLSKQLLEKYGRPIFETGHCPTPDEITNHFVRDPLNTLECTRLWREPTQTIEMSFRLVLTSLFLTVEYNSRSISSSEL